MRPGCMTQYYPTEIKQGDVTIMPFEIKYEDTLMFNVRAMRDNGNTLHNIIAGNFTKLIIGNELVMSDTPMEIKTNARVFGNAYGDVLIAGLGLGMLPVYLQHKVYINSITILEINKNVIDLVTKQIKFNDKVKIIHADAKTYLPEYKDKAFKHQVKYDYIYLDIWSECLPAEEAAELKAYYKKFLRDKRKKVHAWIDVF